MQKEKPWLKHYGQVPHSIEYPRVTMYEAVMQTVQKCPDMTAYDFFGYTSSYSRFKKDIDKCADALASLGMRKGDRITISMPTTPQGIICFYAANKLGAVSSLIHPLSTANEIEFFLNSSRSRFALTLDAFYGKFREVGPRTDLKTLILARIPDYLSPLKRLGFYFAKGRKIPPVPKETSKDFPDDFKVRWWSEIMSGSYPRAEKAEMATDDLAVILFSGGTTGVPKGIMLSNRNFISEGMQVSAWGNLSDGERILAILPIFHGFGLGVCVNACFMGGGTSILVPQFTPETVAQLIRSKRPTLLVGVPTLFDALSRDPVMHKADLSCLKATFSGADTLPRTVKERFEEIVRKQGGSVQLLEGYGLTEAVTAIMATPIGQYREGSIGVPFPDMHAKIVRPGTTEELPAGEEGEICLHGPAVMLGYLDHPEETAETLRTHKDGKIWLHTGDIAAMDEDGFFYFKLRLKRMIKSSGMNVYPSQVEEVLYRHPEVREACVIGVPDEAQVERVKAFVVLKDPAKAGAGMEKAIIGYCREHLIKWSCPREVEFRNDLPKTLVGKIAFNILEKEEIERLRAEGKYTGK
ncbi:MAG: AMP-binding protein [Syntrophales bacterium]|nr:AMP-binding protein [Syntrophales bacterium]MDD5234074.1 AMP-binding protein [Syntrophales bacterium]MDD5531842.1 AMP-binding protein [Syntrophales bacterium]